MPSLEAKAKTPPAKSKEDLKSIQADVASFASSLGFASAGVGAGFNDVDFRKTGPINDKKAPKTLEKKKPLQPHQIQKESSASNKQLQFVKTKEGQQKRKIADSESRDGKKRKLNRKSFEVDEGRVGNNSKQGKSPTSFKNNHNQRAFRESNNYQREKEMEGKVVGKDSSRIFSKIWSLLKSGPWYEAAAALLSTGEANEALGILEPGNRHAAGKQGGDVKATKPKSNGAEDWDKLVAQMRKEGEDLMEKAAADYEKSRGKDSDMRWLMVARRTGTTADKVASFTVLLQDNPIANLKALDALLGMVTSKGGKRHAAMGIDALKELFVTSLLPDVKLKYITQQPLQARRHDLQDGARLLFLWYWEDCVKHRYEQFVNALEEATKDNLPFLKDKAIKTIYELLKSKPEQERKLLSALVNKLGDPERKVASNAGYFLSCLLTAHPNMKMVVVEEVDSFLFRFHMGLRSRYQAVVFLNQIVLSNRGDGPKLAKRLVDIYFALFKVITVGEFKDGAIKGDKKRNSSRNKNEVTSFKNHNQDEMDADTAVEIDSRILSALLTGVNRAFPFVAADDVDTLIEEHSPVLFRLVHSKNFNVGVQALMLLYQLLAKNHAVSDRLYRALYAVLLSPGLAKSSKVEIFLGLVFKAIKSDINSKRMAAFAKRLMQVALQQPPQFACGCLLLLSEVLKSRPTLWNAVTQPEDEDEETEHFQDIAEEMNTSLNAAELSSCQEVGANDRGQAIAAKVPSEGITEGEEHSSESDEEELGCSVPDLGDEDDSSSADEGDGEQRQKKKNPIKIAKEKVRFSTTGNVQTVAPSNPVNFLDESWPRKGSYNLRHREPSFCNADQACWWELTALASHVHPSVATMAKTLLSGASILYSGDPLRDLALGVFLDRFAEKKPKPRRKDGNWHGSSLSAPARKAATSSSLPVGLEFLQLSERDVAPEDVVFHKFYTFKSKSKQGKAGKKREVTSKDDITAVDGNEDDFLSGDDSDNDEINGLLEQDAGMDMGLTEFPEEGEESDGEYDYEKLDKAFELANGELGLEEEDSGGEQDFTSAGGSDDSDLDMADKVDEDLEEIPIAARKKGSKTKRQSMKGRIDGKISGEENSKKSPFASFDDYSHVLDNGIVEDNIERKTAQRGKQKTLVKKKPNRRS